MTDPQRPADPPQQMITHKRRPVWDREIIQDAEKFGALDGSSRESKRPRPYSSYVALLCDIIDAEPSSYVEATNKKVCKDAIIEGYRSIMKNDVWDVVLRPKGKSVVTSK